MDTRTQPADEELLASQETADFERALYASLDQGTVRTGRFVRDAAEVPQTT